MTTDQKTAAIEHFNSNPKARSLFMTEDAQFFAKEHDALQHKNGSRHREDVVEVFRTDLASELNTVDNSSSSSTVVNLPEMNMAELKAHATEKGYAEEEWKSFKSKAELMQYLINKKAGL